MRGTSDEPLKFVHLEGSRLLGSIDHERTVGGVKSAERVCAGELPWALRRKGAARARWFDDFVRASIERDALELNRIRERQAMADLLAFL